MGRRNAETDKLEAPADFRGPTEDRHCTDILFLILIVCMWIAMTGVGLHTLSEGDYRLVLYPLDYDGNICGTDFAADMTDFPYLYYVNTFTGGVCVKECPDLTNVTADNLTDIRTLVTYDGIFQASSGQAELDMDFIQVANYSNSNDSLACTDDLCFPNDSPADSWNSVGVRRGFGYAYYAATTYRLLLRCYVTNEAEDRIAQLVGGSLADRANDALEDVYEFWNRLFGDLWIARFYILGFGFGLSFLVSFLYIFLMRIPILLPTIVWTSIFLTIGMFFAAGYFAWNQATEWDDAVPQTVTDNTIKATSISAIVMYTIGGLLVLLTCCMRKAIQLAIKCVKEAGKAVNSMPIILLIPTLQAAGLIAFLSVWVVYGIHLASMGEISTEEFNLPGGEALDVPYRRIIFDDFTRKCGWFLLFCLFWTANFIVALGDMMVSLSVAKWYFQRDKRSVGSGAVIGSIWQTLYYHAGTCAYGSFLIATIQLIRAMIAKAQKTAKDTNNKIAQYLLCCCQCCFWCLENCIKFINKNAYIQTAIFSTAFCASCREAFYLIVRNAARFTAVTYVSAAILIVGKLFISAVTTAVGYYVITDQINDELYSVGGPVVVIFLITYWISDFFMDVFDMGIATVLHCLIADEEMFDGDQQYADKGLQKYVDDFASNNN